MAILVKPVVSEKMTDLSEKLNRYGFVVSVTANKIEIKKAVEKAYGCYIEDINHNKYIDTALGSGTHILGHSPEVIMDSIHKQLKKGVLYCAHNSHTYEVAELIKQCVPSTVDSVVFCNTGSEATMRAARIARAYSTKKKIAIFSGSWHGGNELFVYDHDYHSNDYSTQHKSAGIPDDFKNNVIVLPYNHNDAFDLIKKNKHDIAMVIIEPSQGSNPRDDMREFLTRLKNVTSKYEIILCFDEMITGFRIGYGGCQEYYNIEADLVTYGKTVGGGLPIGVVAGRKEIMSVINGDSKSLPVFMGGTFSANPLTMQVSKTLLTYLYTNKDKVYPHLNNMGNYLKSEVNKFCSDTNKNAQMIGIGSMLRLVHTKSYINSKRERDDLESNESEKFYNNLLLKEYVFVNGNRLVLLSMAHTKKIVDEIINSFKKYL